MTINHDSFLAWPNGGGETPCSSLYAQAHDAHEEAERLASEAEEEQDWGEYTQQLGRAETLRMQLQELREQGHVGAPVEYGQTLPLMALLGGATMTADGRIFNGERLVGQL